MLKKRLIPCLLLQNGQLVKSINFKNYQIIGNPKTAVEYFNAWSVDELIFLDITKQGNYSDLIRKDYNYKFLDSFVGFLREISKVCFVPLSAGGGIKNINQVDDLFRNGADKVVINSEAFKRPDFITEISAKYGNQAVIVSMDVKKNNLSNIHEVFIDCGHAGTGTSPIEWAIKAEEKGAGEIFLTSIDKDGSLQGYDLELVKMVTDSVSIPVIACGGVGKWQDLVDGIKVGGASAVSAANIFHFTEQSTRFAKKYMYEAGVDVRI